AMALAIDPEADIMAMVSPAATEDETEPRRPEGELEEHDAGARGDEAPSSPPAIAPPPASEQRRRRERPSRRPFTFALEARAELTSSIAPVLAPTFGVAAEARAHVFRAAVWLGPAVAIG